MAVWDDETNRLSDPPAWLLTGHMLLWSDGSPAHIDMGRSSPSTTAGKRNLMISRSALHGTGG